MSPIEGEELNEPLPKVEKIIDQYSIIAKFLNSIEYHGDVVFPLSYEKFTELHIKIHENNTGKNFHPDPKTKEFQIDVENRTFKFIKKK
jgi:hypothetical protein